jgi:hypothetical protein
MKRTLRILALIVALAGAGYWFGTGANRGWSKNRVEIKTVDEVTGIEGSQWEDRFNPGIDFLAMALGAALVLAGTSFIFRTKTESQKPN